MLSGDRRRPDLDMLFALQRRAPGPFHAMPPVCGLRDTSIRGLTRPRLAGFCLGVDRMTPSPRIVEVRQNVLKHNDEIARRLRRRFEDQGVFVISLVSSPGSGKTTFLEKTLTILN